jgi:hypothetical protein
MKKSILYIFILGLLYGCSNSDVTENSITNNNSKGISFKVGVNNTTNNAPSRAGGSNVIPTGETMRIVMEIFIKGSSECINHQERTTTNNDVYTTGFNFEDVKIPPSNDYIAVCWADFGSAYYNADNLQDIEQLYANKTSAQNDAEDAYSDTITFKIDADGNANKTLALTLKRTLNKVWFQRVRLNDAKDSYNGDEYANFIRYTYYYNYRSFVSTSSFNIIYDKAYTHYNALLQQIIRKDDAGYYRITSRNIFGPADETDTFSFYDYLLADNLGSYSVNCHIRYGGTIGDDNVNNTNGDYGILKAGSNFYSDINIVFPAPNKSISIKKADDDTSVLDLYYRRISTLKGNDQNNPWLY